VTVKAKMLSVEGIKPCERSARLRQYSENATKSRKRISECFLTGIYIIRQSSLKGAVEEKKGGKKWIWPETASKRSGRAGDSKGSNQPGEDPEAAASRIRLEVSGWPESQRGIQNRRINSRIHPSGLEERLVKQDKDFDGIDSKKHIVRSVTSAAKRSGSFPREVAS